MWITNIDIIKGYFLFLDEYLLYASCKFFILNLVDWLFFKAQTSEVFKTLWLEIFIASFAQLKNILEKIPSVI